MRSEKLTCLPERQGFIVRSAPALVSLDYAAVCVALPKISQQLSLTSQQTPAVLAAYGLCFAAVSLTGGVLWDRTRPRQVFITGMLTFLLASVIGALACNGEWMIAARALQGTGMALIRQAFNAGLTEREKKNRAPDTAVVTGLAAGLLLGVLLSLIDWRLIFMINLPAGWLICRYFGPASPQERSSGLTFSAGALIACFAAGSFFLALTAFARTGQPDFILNRITAVACLLFLFHEKWSPRPLFPRSLRNNTAFYIGWLGRLCYMGSAGSQWYLLVFYWQQQRVSPGYSGGLFCLAVLLIITGGQLYHRLSGRMRYTALLTGGFLFSAAGLFLAGNLCDRPLSVAFACGVCLSSLGQGMLCPMLFSTRTRGIAEKMQEQTATVMLICLCAGGAIVLAILNVMTAGARPTADWQQAFHLTGGLAMAGCLVAFNTPSAEGSSRH